jgi:selenide,water dikinase
MANQLEIKLTEFTHGGGCGCKIAPAVLKEILNGKLSSSSNNLLIGNSTNDDAAAYDLGNGTALISTTDFFMPIVDDAFTFGKIAAVNAISDVYAMGGKPIMALALLGWPVDKLPAQLASDVLDGAREACSEAGISLAGGHSIDNLEPLFGLSVNGIIDIKNLKRNIGAQEGDLIYLTKPLGVGIISSAVKKKIASQEESQMIIDLMSSPNKIGAAFGELDYVNAMTDVTGFGLLGHLIEMAEGSELSAELWFNKVPTLPMGSLQPFIDQYAYPSNTFKNFSSYGSKVSQLDRIQLPILCDPQTSGGLLVAINPAFKDSFETVLKDAELRATAIGQFTNKQDKVVTVKS